MAKIKSIEKGYGIHSIFYTTDVNDKLTSCIVTKITERFKNIGTTNILVYTGYIDDDIIFEMEAGHDITLTFCK